MPSDEYELTPADVERMANVFLVGAAALTYVTTPERWPGFVAWVEQVQPALPGEFASDSVRAMVREDARLLLAMGNEAEGEYRERG